MSGTVLAFVLIVAACGGSSAPTSQSSPSSAAPSPSPSASLAAANCDLPVWLPDHGGFIRYPGGGLTEAPASTIVGETGGHITEAKPQLHGDSGLSYDRLLDRWLPVYYHQVSLDGVSYAYFTAPTAVLRVVDVASGTSRVAFSGDPALIWNVVSFRPEGIYVWHSNGPGGGDSDPGRLWRVTSSTTLAPISDRRSVGGWRIFGGYAWGVETDDLSKLGQPGNEERLLRIDLNSGAASVWFRRTGTLIESLGGLPDGSALVLVGDPLALWMVAGPQNERQIASMGASGDSANDSHGVWLLNGSGTWLVTASGQVVLVSMRPLVPVGECA